MNAGAVAPLLTVFDNHWRLRRPEFALQISGYEVDVDEAHPLRSEVVALCSGQAASLPHFIADEVIWCTVAPDGDSLRSAIADLQAWVLPSFGGEGAGDGYIESNAARGALSATILTVSPTGYYKWRCRLDALPVVLEKLTLHRGLEARKPPRSRPTRPSLYELRARFASALLTGDREGAEDGIELLDSLQLDSAVNTQFMRLRMWYHFREFDRIRDHPELGRLLAQPLPRRVQHWINEAFAASTLGEAAGAKKDTEPVVELEFAAIQPDEETWLDWFESLRRGDRSAAEAFVIEHRKRSPTDLTPAEVTGFVSAIEDLFLDDTLRHRERDLIVQGIAEFLEEFVREPEFPRAAFGDLYLALLRIWAVLHAGISSGQEHGHVLLELASAALQLNRAPEEVLQTVESWWEARQSRSQLPFLLDAIELLEREFPKPEAPANLWLAAADLILRFPDWLTPSEADLWRRVGQRLGIDQASIAHYLPKEAFEGELDPLGERELKHVAIVCMRERQAREAADEITRRSRAVVTIVSEAVAGPNTAHARRANVVLFVWMASTHSIFRAFDGFDRRHFCYVQGTGASSIIRTLERWALA